MASGKSLPELTNNSRTASNEPLSDCVAGTSGSICIQAAGSEHDVELQDAQQHDGVTRVQAAHVVLDTKVRAWLLQTTQQWSSLSALGRKHMPTPYSSGFGRSTPQSFLTTVLRKSWGIATRQPAPSPGGEIARKWILRVQDAPGLLLMSSDKYLNIISSASVTHCLLGSLFSSPTKPTPHASWHDESLQYEFI
ncbi:MAG: hypothetical protein FRX49_07673 [Trebouxia sp. A1-2]|nr:MAG: hypothetical protein FRX49_07673 [Trebouxia sp. A1-2]